MSPTPESLAITLDRLRLLRHRIAMTAKKPTDEDPSFAPLLSASAEVAAIDVALRVLAEKLKEEAS